MIELPSHVMGMVWAPDRPERTEIGHFLAAAKEQVDAPAIQELARRLAEFARTCALPRDGLWVPVPADPARPNPLVRALAEAVALAHGGSVATVIERRGSTGPVREASPGERGARVAAADYCVIGDVRGREVVLIDDVVLTGTTLDHLAGLLREQGASRVEALVAARSRRAQPS